MKRFLMVSFLIIGILLIFIIIKVSVYLSERSSKPNLEEATALAIQRRDVGICDTVKGQSFGISADGTTDEMIISQCYQGYIKAYPDEKVCARRPNDSSCALMSARLSGDVSFCGQDPYCVAAGAYHKKDVKVCYNSLNLADLQKKCAGYMVGVFN